jgi:hypothetical protein
MKKIKIKKSLITSAVVLSSISIMVPTLLTSCGNKPKYTISWSSQVANNIEPYEPTGNEYNFMDQNKALDL